MDGFVDPVDGMRSRRKLLVTAAWTVPVIATMTATPAFAASASPSVNALTLSKINLSDTGTGGLGGPIAIGLQLDYDKSSAQYPDTISFAWALTVSGAAKDGTVELGSGTVSRYGKWQEDSLLYPKDGSSLPQGTYDFTFTVSVAGSGSRSTTRKIRI